MATTHQRPASLEKAIAASKVDPADEPSVGWGWHAEPRKSFQVIGWLFTLFLPLYLIGNHSGRVEDAFIIGFTLLFAAMLIGYGVQSRKARRR